VRLFNTNTILCCVKNRRSHSWIFWLQYVAAQACVICALLCESYLKRTTCSDSAACRTNRTTDQCCSDYIYIYIYIYIYMQQVGLHCSVILNSCYRSPQANSVTYWDNIILKFKYLRRTTKHFVFKIMSSVHQCAPVYTNVHQWSGTAQFHSFIHWR